MGDIKPLPEAIHNSVRSGIILYDMARVVEELIFNSLDAGATKISIAVGAATCYLKLADNGCGITRDGLVLVAERYASSKFNDIADSHAVARSFGFRGEALNSIANVSLLEILTKAQGRPNGYRKVMKGCKCLFIGIDDGRQDVGTTVIVRDLFYNQPVRRKLIQSSTKKELESVKNCVLRISLVHPKVSFKVVDIESDDELFSSSPSSPLSRILNAFGVEIVNSVHELNVTDGLLELSGFMSSPFDISSVKAFQYIYINSRYISKGAVHKLLNQLVNSINSLQHQKGNMISQIENQSKIQTCCTFILNLRCPRSWYDVAFEPSKTSVDFKDWKAIIGFIKKGITRFWSEIPSHGDDLSEGIGLHVPTDDVEIQAAYTYSRGEAKYRADKRKDRVPNHASPVAFPSSSLEMQSKKYDHLDYLRGTSTSCPDITYQNDSFMKSFDEWPATTRIAVDQEIGICDWRPDHNVFPNEDQLVGNKYFVPEKYKEQVDLISKSDFDEKHLQTSDPFGFGIVGSMSNDFEISCLQKCTSRKRRALDEDSLLISNEFETSLTNEYFKSDFPIDHFKNRNADNMNKVLEEPFLQICTSRKKRSLNDESFVRSESSDFPMEGLRYKKNSTSLHRRNDLLVKTGLDFRSRSQGFELDFNEKPWRGYEEYNFIAKRGNMEQFVYSDDNFFSPFRGLDTHSDFKTLYHSEEDSLLFHPQDRFFDVTFPGSSDMFIDETKGLSSELYGNSDDYCCVLRSTHKSVDNQDRKTMKDNFWKTRLKRSHSAPPFYEGKNKAFALINDSAEEVKKGEKQSVDNLGSSQEADEWKHHKLSSAELEKCKIQSVHDLCKLQEADESKHPQRSSTLCPMGSESNSMRDLLVYTRETNKRSDNCSIRKIKEKVKLEDLEFNCTISVEDTQDPVVPGLKWRDYPEIANGEKTRKSHNEDRILNVYSGQLQLAGDLLVPKSISKNFLNNAKVLQQVDKKFIPVVGNGVLAVIDQHAADERIRLEELRQKVLAGERKTITYLDIEQKLVMPEMGYQLLHTYAEQTQNWGWLCYSLSQDSKSFKKNLSILHKQPRGITLVAVPCILGVNLTDVDLLEFLQQLADTDGSSTIPPSVHRVLNSKACRGAIMFGDTLLPSECSLIVDELKQTALCFQCAHGRPTTVPLINMEALQKQVEKFGSWNAKPDTWHGLQRHVPSLERAISRLTQLKCNVHKI